MIRINQNHHMGLNLQFSLIYLSLIFFTILGSSSSSSSSDNTNLIFKGCANQKFQDPTGIYSTTLDTLFSTLVSQSSSSKFYKTTAGEGQSAIIGLFQCRGDLSNADCSNCVSKLPKMFKSLCGPTIAARIQLGGCYLRYEVAGFKQGSGTELLYKVCGSNRVSGSGFEERLGSALGEIDKGVVSGNGFYTGGYELVYVLGQCEGDLVGGDCVDCVKSAEQRAKSDCGDSISGQIYLQQCYITYTYYPNGVPSGSGSGSGSGRGSSGSGTTLPSETGTGKGRGQNTQKTVAIVVGGLVGLGLFIACLLVLKSAFKKKREVQYY